MPDLSEEFETRILPGLKSAALQTLQSFSMISGHRKTMHRWANNIYIVDSLYSKQCPRALIGSCVLLLQRHWLICFAYAGQTEIL